MEKLTQAFWDYLEMEKGASRSTVEGYKYWIGKFLAFSKIKSSKELSKTKLTLFRKQLVKEGLSETSRRIAIVAIRSFVRWMNTEGYETMPTERVALPKVSQTKPNYLKHDEIKRLLRAPNGRTKRGIRDKAVLEVLFSTGLRVGELVNLNKEQIDWQTREISVKGKGGHRRVVFLGGNATKALKRYLKRRPETPKPLFLVGNNRMSVRVVQRLVKKYAQQENLVLTPHGLRHTFATNLLSQGVDIRYIQEFLGHRSLKTTQVYTHVTNKKLRNIHSQYQE